MKKTTTTRKTKKANKKLIEPRRSGVLFFVAWTAIALFA
jgi:hypothetical protein